MKLSEFSIVDVLRPMKNFSSGIQTQDQPLRILNQIQTTLNIESDVESQSKMTLSSSHLAIYNFKFESLSLLTVEISKMLKI